MAIHKYQAFVKVAEMGSITKAAEAMGYTQSAVSRMVADLEDEWNLSLLRRSRGVEASISACSAAGPRPGLRERLTRESGQLMTWALEDSLERADAMRARGWESGTRRTSYRADILRESDAAKTCGVVVLALLCAFLAVVACGQWSFYPVMPALVCWWGYAPYAALMLLPAAAAVAERIRWRGLE